MLDNPPAWPKRSSCESEHALMFSPCSTSSGKNSGSSCDDSEMSENLKPEATAWR